MKLLIISLGCSKNLVDSENISILLRNDGHKFVVTVEEAEAVIIQTCSFIESARKESKKFINEILRFKKNNEKKLVLVTGCWVQHYREKLSEIFPEVDYFVGSSELAKIRDIFAQHKKDENKFYYSVSGGGLLEIPATLNKYRKTSLSYAYVRIAEGCNSRCSFCVIPQIRGKFRSRKIESIVNEVKQLVKNGVREINLISQNTTYYGYDLYNEFKLSELLQKLNQIEKLKWIRLLYTDLKYYDNKLIDTIAQSQKVCKYLDIPLQHINTQILARMQRGIDTDQIIKKINYLRKNIPGLVLRTTFMVGFPGETDKAFQELIGFVKETKFNHLGSFIYSREDGTPAAELPNQVPEKIKKERQKMVMLAQQKNVEYANNQKIGKIYEVIVENFRDKEIWGRSREEAPEVDNKICFNNKLKEYSTFVKCKIIGYRGYDLIGEII